MGFRKVVKKSLFSNFNVGQWLDLQSIKANGRLISKLFNKVFKGKKTEKKVKETFEGAMYRLNMSEEDLKNRIKNGQKIVWFCLTLGVVGIAYTIYQFSLGEILAGMVCLMLTTVIAANGCRESFNVYQMRQRRLGCTFKEWFFSLVKLRSHK